MLYSELLKRLEPHKIKQIGKLMNGTDTIVYLGMEVVFPYRAQLHGLYAQGDDWDVDEEEIAAVLRRFSIKSL